MIGNIYLNTILILGINVNICAVNVGDVWEPGLPTVANFAKSWHNSFNILPNVATVFPISTKDGVVDFKVILPLVW